MIFSAEIERRTKLDPRLPHAYFMEEELESDVATIILTGRECPFRCVMCDLWKNTLPGPTPKGAVVAQIDHALARLPRAPWIKLYNAGSFFDRSALPISDHEAIAERVGPFERIIVESHPKLIGADTFRFRDLLRGPRLEVAIGLETANPAVLPRLNEGSDLSDFERAARALLREGVALRAFVLIQPPFEEPELAAAWAARSAELAFDQGAETVVLIPTRGGNPAMKPLEEAGLFRPPDRATIDQAFERTLGLKRGRVLLDSWGLDLRAGGENETRKSPENA